MATPTRILVLGGTGMLGHAAVRVFAEAGCEVHATVRDAGRAARFELPAQLHELTAESPEALPEVIARSGAEAVLNAVGIVKQLDDASRAVPSITVNSLFPHQTAEACQSAGVRLVHVSTDCVFSGRLEAPGRYREDDVPDASDLYGRSKLLGEVASGDALTLRTSIIGPELERASGLYEWLVSQRGRPVKGFAGAVFSGLTTTALARTVFDVLGSAPQLRGLYHLAAEPIDKHELLTRLDEALGLGCQIERVSEPRINRALDDTRFRQDTGMPAPSWNEMIGEYAREVSDAAT